MNATTSTLLPREVCIGNAQRVRRVIRNVERYAAPRFIGYGYADNGVESPGSTLTRYVDASGSIALNGRATNVERVVHTQRGGRTLRFWRVVGSA